LQGVRHVGWDVINSIFFQEISFLKVMEVKCSLFNVF
jgi:hypothetical protein